MSTFEVLFVLLLWYIPGFLTAAVMARRGHDPLPWIYAAWIGGVLCLVAALARLAAGRAHAALDEGTAGDTRPSTTAPQSDRRDLQGTTR